ncbi:MAG TPA: type I-MYXAN CRISPR-associated protein Cas6/Cmx6 [Gammaproteobacteria bacterium]|nr:type I-MYXAN CRISPR-associated protein Cas6/Cmx6 [Gammaproteobacteria bacterium]
MKQNFWTEEKDSQTRYVISDDVMDFVFSIKCKCLPYEHMYALYQALQQALPWLDEEDLAGIQAIYGAESGNGWQRPEGDSGELMYISHRQKLILRMPKTRMGEMQGLVGQSLDIAGYSLALGKMETRLLSDMPTVFARFVISDEDMDESLFLEQAAEKIQAMDIGIRKMLAGIQRQIMTPDGVLHTRSLMLADLEPEESVRLQQRGLGSHRHLGCGLFLPQKGISPVSLGG